MGLSNGLPEVFCEEVVIKPDCDLYLDDIVVSGDLESNSLVPLSASRLRLLQDTTMIESALDLDSLEESTSSVGAGSQAALIKKKDTL